jgi:hypothetical protein
MSAFDQRKAPPLSVALPKCGVTRVTGLQDADFAAENLLHLANDNELHRVTEPERIFEKFALRHARKGFRIFPLKPSGMGKAADAASSAGRKGRRGAKRTAAINETHILKPDSLPDGARFKGYEDFIVQDIVIKPWMVRYRRERWLLPSPAGRPWPFCQRASPAISDLTSSASS